MKSTKHQNILIISILGFLLYLNSFFNGFVWDDEEQVVNNPVIHSLANIPSLFTQSTFNGGGAVKMGGLYFRPMMTTAYTFIYSIFGSSAFFFHFFQAILHIGGAVLLFLILNHFLKKENLSLLLSLIFLVHPINSETVLYVADLSDILFFFFGALAFWILISKDDLKYPFISSFLLLASVLSKETGAVWWIVSAAYLFVYKKGSLKVFLPLLAFWAAIYAYLRFGIAQIFFAKHGLAPISKMTLSERLINVPAVAFYYLKTYVWPLKLAINQQWVIKDISLIGFFLPLLVDLAFLSVIFYGAWYLYKKKDQHLAFYLIFLTGFLFAMGVHLQILPLDLTVSERLFYLPQIFLLGMVGVFLLKIKKETTVYWVLAVLIILFSVRTFVRTFDWRNGLTLFSHDIKISDYYDMEDNLGVELYRIGDYENAKMHFERSIQMAPDWWSNYNNLGAYYQLKGDYPDAEKMYLVAAKNGNYYLAIENYASLLYKEKKYGELKDFLSQYLPYFPDNQTLNTLWQAVQ
jgi:tetratricopeptide (TPR) repeat protein